MKTRKKPDRDSPRELSWGGLAGCVGATLRFAENEIYSRTSEVLAPFGLTPGSFTVLVLIDENHEPTQGEIGLMVLMKKGNFAGLISGLEKRGLVMRTPCAEDGRKQRLALTESGEALLSQASDRHNAFNAALVEHVGRTAHDRLIVLLEKLRGAPRVAAISGEGSRGNPHAKKALAK